MFTFKRIAIAAAAALTLASAAQASGDITVVNRSQAIISPYVKTNCWNEAILAEGPDTWVYFGGVLPGTQFNWNDFYQLLDPQCRNPVVKFTFVVYGSEAPVSVDPDLTQLMHYDATENYRIVVGGKIVITERPQ